MGSAFRCGPMAVRVCPRTPAIRLAAASTGSASPRPSIASARTTFWSQSPPVPILAFKATAHAYARTSAGLTFTGGVVLKLPVLEAGMVADGVSGLGDIDREPPEGVVPGLAVPDGSVVPDGTTGDVAGEVTGETGEAVGGTSVPSGGGESSCVAASWGRPA